MRWVLEAPRRTRASDHDYTLELGGAHGLDAALRDAAADVLIAPLFGPSKTHGAASRSQHKEPRKVSMRRWPCGARPRRQLLLGLQPRAQYTTQG